jgi:hypothetical protein
MAIMHPSKKKHSAGNIIFKLPAFFFCRAITILLGEEGQGVVINESVCDEICKKRWPTGRLRSITTSFFFFYFEFLYKYLNEVQVKHEIMFDGVKIRFLE